LDAQGNFLAADSWIDLADEPGHQDLCNREQSFFLRCIREDLDQTEAVQDAVASLRIALACDESVRTGQVVTLVNEPITTQNNK
jgi:hypothetical protein